MQYRNKGGNLVYEARYRGQIQIGEFASLLAGEGGMPLSSARTFVLRVCCDDNGKALTVGNSYNCTEDRMLLTVAHPGDVSVFGHKGHIKVTADESGNTAHIAGEWSYIEMVSGAHVNIAAGHKSMADCPSGGVINGVLAAYLATSNTLAGTHTGKAVAFHIPNPVAGTWDAAFGFGSASGACASGATALSGLTSAYHINVLGPDGNIHYIPLI